MPYLTGSRETPGRTVLTVRQMSATLSVGSNCQHFILYLCLRSNKGPTKTLGLGPKIIELRKISKVLCSRIRSDQIRRSVMSDSLRPHESKHARPPCPSPTPGVH